VVSPEDAIRARRRLTNKLIAAHEAERLRPFFTPDAKVVAGDGSLILGRDAVIEAFSAQFADPAFVTYERMPDLVELDGARSRAAEHGRWVAKGSTPASGPYLAAWRKVTGQWLIESELFVTLS